MGPDEFNRLTSGLVAVDAIIAKVSGVSELTQMARTERILRGYLATQWRIVSEQAAVEASKLVRGSGVPAASDAKKVQAKVKDVMSTWAPLVSRRVATDLEHIYRLARNVGWQKAHGRIRSKLTYNVPVLKAEGDDKAEAVPSFDTADENAIKSINDQTLFWMGEHYDRNVSDTIADTARETMLEQGLDRNEAGKALRDALLDTLGDVTIPDGFHGSAEDYFSGLAANATTVARNYGQMKSFDDADIEEYVITNPGDERECERCVHMDGKVFSVQAGMDQMQSEMDLDDPEDIQDEHPWLTLSDILDINPRAGAGKADAGFVKAGFHMPPFHFHCRCTVDLASA